MTQLTTFVGREPSVLEKQYNDFAATLATGCHVVQTSIFPVEKLNYHTQTNRRRKETWWHMFVFHTTPR